MTDHVPTSSDAVLIKLARIATHAQALTASENPLDKAPVGLRKMRNDRRRAAEKILVILADPELRDYLAQLNVREENL